MDKIDDLYFDVHGNLQPLERELKAAENKIKGQKITVKVGLDQAAFDRELDAFVRRATAKLHLKGTVSLDTSAASAEITRLEQRVARLTGSMGGNTGGYSVTGGGYTTTVGGGASAALIAAAATRLYTPPAITVRNVQQRAIIAPDVPPSAYSVTSGSPTGISTVGHHHGGGRFGQGVSPSMIGNSVTVATSKGGVHTLATNAPQMQWVQDAQGHMRPQVTAGGHTAVGVSNPNIAPKGWIKSIDAHETVKPNIGDPYGLRVHNADLVDLKDLDRSHANDPLKGTGHFPSIRGDQMRPEGSHGSASAAVKQQAQYLLANPSGSIGVETNSSALANRMMQGGGGGRAIVPSGGAAGGGGGGLYIPPFGRAGARFNRFMNRNIGGLGFGIAAYVGADQIDQAIQSGRDASNNQLVLDAKMRAGQFSVGDYNMNHLVNNNANFGQRLIDQVPLMRNATGIVAGSASFLMGQGYKNPVAEAEAALAQGKVNEIQMARQQQMFYAQRGVDNEARILGIGTSALNTTDSLKQMQFGIDAEVEQLEQQKMAQLDKMRAENGSADISGITDEFDKRIAAVKGKGARDIARQQRAYNMAVNVNTLTGVDDREAAREGIRAQYNSDDPHMANIRDSALAAEERLYGRQSGFMSRGAGINMQSAQGFNRAAALAQNQLDYDQAIAGLNPNDPLQKQRIDAAATNKNAADLSVNKEFRLAVKEMTDSTKVLARSIGGDNIGATLDSLESQKQIAMERDPEKAKEIAESFEMQKQAARVNDAQQKAQFGLGTKSINMGTARQNMRNDGNYIKADAQGVIDDTSLALQQIAMDSTLTPEQKKSRSDALKESGRASLAGIEKSFMNSMRTENIGSAYELVGGMGGMDPLAQKAVEDIQGLEGQIAKGEGNWNQSSQSINSNAGTGQAWSPSDVKLMLDYLKGIADNVGVK